MFDDTAYGDSREVRMVYRLPLAEIVTDFFGKLKSRSSELYPNIYLPSLASYYLSNTWRSLLTGGFAAFEYEDDGYIASDLVKVCRGTASAAAQSNDLAELLLVRLSAFLLDQRHSS